MANSIPNPVDTRDPIEFFANSCEVRTMSRNAAAGENLVRGQLVMSDAAGLIVAHDGGTAPAMVVVEDVDATAGSKPVNVYTNAAIFLDKITWPATADTDDKKMKLVEGTGITVYKSEGGY